MGQPRVWSHPVGVTDSGQGCAHTHAQACTHGRAWAHAHTPPAESCMPVSHFTTRLSLGGAAEAHKSQAGWWFKEGGGEEDPAGCMEWSWPREGSGPACPGQEGCRWAKSTSRALTRVLLHLLPSQRTPPPVLGTGRGRAHARCAGWGCGTGGEGLPPKAALVTPFLVRNSSPQGSTG